MSQAREASRGRGGAARPKQLPNQPRRREEFAPSSQLAGSGARVVGANAQAPPRAPSQRRAGGSAVGSAPVSARSEAIPGGFLPDRRDRASAAEATEAAGDPSRQDEAARPPSEPPTPSEQSFGASPHSRRIGGDGATPAQQDSRLQGSAVTGEAALRAELEEVRERARRDRDELLERVRVCDGERCLREGERDEARAHVQELETRLGAALNAPEEQEARLRALEMELSLVRSRLVRETDARDAAERATQEAKAQQQQLKASLEKSLSESRQLRRNLAQQAELANFRQENCTDLQARLKDQQIQAEVRIQREKGKFEAVRRLEGVLPRHLLMKALSST